jgi:hypothetical protein
MMVDRRITERFDRLEGQLIERAIGIERSVRDLPEQNPDALASPPPAGSNSSGADAASGSAP